LKQFVDRGENWGGRKNGWENSKETDHTKERGQAWGGRGHEPKGEKKMWGGGGARSYRGGAENGILWGGAGKRKPGGELNISVGSDVKKRKKEIREQPKESFGEGGENQME